ncbi:MAG: sugar MFS transporter [Cellvibrionaceae bacterium]
MSDTNTQSPESPNNPSEGSNGLTHQSTIFPMVMLTSLFFIWGFMTALNDILIPHLKNAFSLNYTQAMLIQFCFFGAYFIASIPAGMYLKKVGYQKGLVTGLVIAGLGCLVFYPAADQLSYMTFLIALFILATGITVLQVSANPYVTILGNPETASSRLTMTQAFNSLGTTLAPIFGTLLILGVATTSVMPNDLEAARLAEAQSVQLPYLFLGGVFFILAIIFFFLRLPYVSESDQSLSSSHDKKTSLFEHTHLMLGAVGIFLYVGAEVSIGSFLVNFLGEDNIAGLEEAEAAKYVSYYWGGAMVGRFIGAAVMNRVRAGYVLAFNASISALLVFVTIVTDGKIAMWSILAVGLFNSVMFPTIFSLAIAQLGGDTSRGSGLLCLAIVGGALAPLLQGILADTVGVQLAFILPIFCYLYIVFYGLKGSIPNDVTHVNVS